VVSGDLTPGVEVATSSLPKGSVEELLTPRFCQNCGRGSEADCTYRFLRADRSLIIELCPRCMAWSILPSVLEADLESA
jgi:hypothetical protein